ncbi:MAG: acyclic terpene utilization AtuA family protein, partial [Candidatus Marinimicrobia bacterium]|nr:acyclic terpene utilization AtuA family protein [Candidatus Neomarinimicrobiota bacterium]
APPSLKVSMAYEDGFTASGSLIIGGADAKEKAAKFAEIFWMRLKTDFEKYKSELVGYDSCNKHLNLSYQPHEILLRMSVYDHDHSKIELFSKTLASLILSGPPGAAVTGGRPRIQKVLSYWPTLIDREYTASEVSLIGEDLQRLGLEIIPDKPVSLNPADSRAKLTINSTGSRNWESSEDEVDVPLRKLCLARSGDKGDASNVGVIARSPEIYSYIKQYMTADFIKYVFAPVCKGRVLRYEMDNLLGLNFILEHSLDGGGTKTLMIDAQGKLFASNLLDFTVKVPRKLMK